MTVVYSGAVNLGCCGDSAIDYEPVNTDAIGGRRVLSYTVARSRQYPIASKLPSHDEVAHGRSTDTTDPGYVGLRDTLRQQVLNLLLLSIQLGLTGDALRSGLHTTAGYDRQAGEP